MSIQISDCTIRDGGYLVNKNFAPEFVHDVIERLTAAGLDYIETGFLQNDCKGETIVFSDSKDIRAYMPADRKHTVLLGSADTSRYSMERLDSYDGQSVEGIRVVFAKHECDAAFKEAAIAKQKGYKVVIQPMDAVGYSYEEWEDLISRANALEPETLSIVDTFGAMHLSDLTSLFTHINAHLNRNIKIGLHSHNNLQLSCALAERMMEAAMETDRNVVIDGSLLGMGRGAGNACTEMLADYLNRKQGKHYDLPLILDTIEKYILPLTKTIHWGYDLPMFICGCESSHVDNVYYLEEHTACSAKQMYEVISSMSPEKRKRYGKGYSKTDYSAVQETYDRVMKEAEKE